MRALLRIIIYRLFTAPAGLAVAAAFFRGFARCRVNATRIIAFAYFAAVGARYFVVVFFDELFEFFTAFFTAVLH